MGHNKQIYQRGFTLIELMVSIAIIAILSGIGIPSYQRYVQKAALTDMLQAMVPYKTAIELCVFEKNTLLECNAGSQGIPSSEKTRYISAITVAKGVMTLTGQESLTGLTVTLTPTLSSTNGKLRWARTCTLGASQTADAAIVNACESVFRFQ